MSALLEARDLSKDYALRKGWFAGLLGRAPARLRAVDGIDLNLADGEILALVGESGSGKTTTGKLITRQEQPSGGDLRFDGTDVTALSGKALKAYRRRVQMIFQNPFEALDPRHRVIDAVSEPLAIHGLGDGAERRRRAEAALAQVELPPSRFAALYPADLSGGQLQRVAIARALVLEPRLIVADEPVSMLDVSVRSGVMNLMLALRERTGVAYLYITHDLAVARTMSSRIAVMYLGAIVEEGPTEALIARGGHPYTRLLVSAVPEHRPGTRRRRIRLAGDAASAEARIPGCRFNPRCPLATDLCRTVVPPRVALGPGRWASCHYAQDVVSRETLPSGPLSSA
jgi:oligopeptide/dipeptide ABC transporter ATP-binding protein